MGQAQHSQIIKMFLIKFLRWPEIDQTLNSLLLCAEMQHYVLDSLKRTNPFSFALNGCETHSRLTSNKKIISHTSLLHNLLVIHSVFNLF